MSPPLSRQRPSVEIPSIKRELSYLPVNVATGCGSLSPDIRSNCPPDFSTSTSTASSVKGIGKYLLFGEPEQAGPFQQCKAFHVETQEEFVCKVKFLNLLYMLVLGSNCALCDTISFNYNKIDRYIWG